MEIEISKVLVANRDRKDFGDILELAESLKRFGQIQPVLVRPYALQPGKEWQLIAGERRLRAAIAAGWSTVEAVTRDDCDDFTLKLLELEENIQRKALLWSEEISAKEELDRLKRQQHGSMSSGRYQDETAWSLEKTALMLDESVATVSRDIKLARAMKADRKLARELLKFPKAVAFKKLKQKEEIERRQRALRAGDLTLTSELIKGDCTELIKTLKDESIALWLTDPPFGVFEVDKAMGNYKDLKVKTDNLNENRMKALYRSLLPSVFAKMEPGAHFYIFLVNSFYPFLTENLRLAGFHVVPQPLVWLKGRTTTIFMGHEYCSKYEIILYGNKPPRSRYLNKAKSNVLQFNALSSGERMHPFHKPPALIDTLIEQSTNVGETVLDTFAGSGQVIESACRLRRNGIGYEIDDDNFTKAQEYLMRCKERYSSDV